MRWFPMTVVMLALSSASWAQPPAPAAQELKELLAYFLDGASRNDAAVHDRFWADDLIYTRSSGVREGKKAILESVRAAPASADEPPVTYSAEDVRVQQYGDTAVVAFRLIGRTGEGDAAVTAQYLNTGTFVKRSGEWRAVAWQATRVPEAESRPQPARDAQVNLTPGAQARAGLVDEILAADAEFFRAFFDACDVATVRRLVTDDFEMFHDKGGRVSGSGAEFVKTTEEKCRRQAEGTDFLSTRKLVPESVKVYPLNNYGAIETGTHRFYAVKKGESDRLTETGQFTIVWMEVDGQWRMARALSYDHVLAQ
jgi:ketosteroid isomerase-like protein